MSPLKEYTTVPRTETENMAPVFNLFVSGSSWDSNERLGVVHRPAEGRLRMYSGLTLSFLDYTAL